MSPAAAMPAGARAGARRKKAKAKKAKAQQRAAAEKQAKAQAQNAFFLVQALATDAAGSKAAAEAERKAAEEAAERKRQKQAADKARRRREKEAAEAKEAEEAAAAARRKAGSSFFCCWLSKKPQPEPQACHLSPTPHPPPRSLARSLCSLLHHDCPPSPPEARSLYYLVLSSSTVSVSSSVSVSLFRSAPSVFLFSLLFRSAGAETAAGGEASGACPSVEQGSASGVRGCVWSHGVHVVSLAQLVAASNYIDARYTRRGRSPGMREMTRVGRRALPHAMSSPNG